MAEKADASQTFTLLAPVSGVIVPISEVPDPTFSEKMVGDGIAIDPAGEVLIAPYDGTVTQLPSSSHALTIKTAAGVEVLMHIGLETVSLKGKGFKAHVKEGGSVKAGDTLISYDADYIARNASSLLTMIVIPTPDVRVESIANGFAKAGETAILKVEAPPGDKTEGEPRGGTTSESEPIAILNPAGIHARPAAVLAGGAKKFSSDIKIVKGDSEANAKSIVGLMGLAIGRHDTIKLAARGKDAREAVDSLTSLIRSGLGENIHMSHVEPDESPGTKHVQTRARIKPSSGNPNLLLGTPASPGLVAGSTFQLKYFDIAVDETGGNPKGELALLLGAIKKSGEELAALENSLRMRADTGKAAIFAAHRELLDDPELISSANTSIESGKSAAFSWKKAYTEQSDMLSNLNNELLAARANDITDIGRRVLSHLTGAGERRIETPDGAILLAKDLTPSDTAGMDKKSVLGFCTTEGSATSHASILARAAGIPAISAIEEHALEIPDGTPAILDGEKGELRLNPSEEEMSLVRRKQAKAEKTRAEELSEAQKPAVTKDGHRIKIVGNISGVSEAEEIPALGGEGVGLLRSEFLFLHRTEAPGEEEQSSVYETIAKTLGNERDLVVRTLDVGGDKPLSYMPLPPEANPFLGVRGIRLNMLGGMSEQLFASQIRAILSAAPYSRLSIMFPMVSSLDELKRAKEVVLREKESLGISERVDVGIMIEVPSAAVMADVLAREADFFSIGTNDLTQYTLAMDRGHPKLASMADALHPAVLRLIDMTVEGAHAHGKWVGICGGIASDATAVPALIGLGVDELSVSIKGIPQVKAAVRRQSLSDCREIAKQALGMATASEVRSFLSSLTGRSGEV